MSNFTFTGLLPSCLCFIIIFTTIVGSTWATVPLQIEPELGTTLKEFSQGKILSSQANDNRVEENENKYKLPDNVRPLHYKLRVMPILQDLPGTNYKKYTSPGEVTITIECVETTDVITLHQDKLDISLDEVKVHDENGQEVGIKEQTMDSSVDFYHIHLMGNLTQGKTYTILIPFIAPISQTELSGLYLSYYVNPQTGETRYLATTQFQPTDARKAFPCFDQPDKKAVFDITVGRHQNFHSLSNMEVANTTPNDELPGWFWDHYDPTSIPLSTYLIAFIVSDFKSVSADEGLYEKPIKIFAAPHLIDAKGGNYAANTAAKIINYYQASFGVEYPLPKLYSLAIPQFSAGAMENAGLNTYRTEYVIHIPGENTEAERKKITQVLAHEISHQWFGNIVTCKTWQYTYLNEGFARFLQYRGMTEAANEFNMDIAIVSDATQLGMIYDHGQSTHPVKNDAQSPDEINEIFDRISYDKGASLLRMVEGFLSRDKFDDSIRFHLKSKMNDNADQSDLFQAFQTTAGDRLPEGVTFEQIMDTWTLQPGYPLVRVEKASSNKIYLSQERYKLNSGANDLTTRSPGSWFIPVKIASAVNPEFEDKTPNLWIPSNTSLLSYSTNVDTTKWLIVNPELVGYYRVLYDTPLRKLITTQLVQNHSVISPGTRSQLIEDYFNLVNAQYTSIESALEFTQYLAEETELVVWTAVFANIRSIMTRLTQEKDALDTFKQYFLPKFEAVLQKLGFEQTPDKNGANVVVRVQLLDYACALNHTECVQYSQRLFDQWVQTPENRTIIPADIRPVVFCAAVGNGGQSSWDQAYSLYQNEKFDATKGQLYKALACAQDLGVIYRYLELAFDGTSGFSIVSTLQNVAGNSLWRELVYRYLVENYGVKGPLGPGEFTAVVTTLSSYWNQQSHIDDLQAFIASNGDTLRPSDLTSLNSSIARVQANILWWKGDARRIVNWIKSTS